MRDSTRWEKVQEIRGFKFIQLKGGRRVSYWDMRKAAERADSNLIRAISRCLKLQDRDYELEDLEWYIRGLHEWVHAVEAEVRKRQGGKTVEERIALLRNTDGRTPEEAAMFEAKADELEQRLKAS